MNTSVKQYIQVPNNLLALLSKYRVVIPGVQRHYVQGANNPKAESVRKQFVKEIFSAIHSGQRINLHFVYGPINTDGEDSFVPVDGQQRLTTLWLIARYAAERMESSIRKDILKLLSRFTYEDRINAKRFCYTLTQPASKWDIDEDPNSEILRQPWFNEYWKEDITVASMIRMLSTIHQEWKNYADLDGERVLEGLGNNISFELKVDSFGDDIYMKMNARGLQLTQWENFKGKYAEKLKDEKDNWESDIENLSNKFFELSAERNELPDDCFFALFSRILAYESKLKCSDNIKNLALFTKWQQTDLPFVPYTEIAEVLNADNALTTIIAQTFTIMVDKVLDNHNAGAPYFSDDKLLYEVVFHPSNLNELDFSICCYVYFKAFAEVDNKTFLKATRLMWNILENVDRDGNNFYNRLSIINRFVALGDPALYACDALNEFNSNDAEQVYEEAQKAVKMYDSNQARPGDWNDEKLGEWVDWKHAIEFAEEQAFFNGSIRFLYSNAEGEATWNQFATKLCNCLDLFDNKGLRADYKHKANRAFISHCTNWEMLRRMPAFDGLKDNWKRMLISHSLSECVNNFLLNPNVIAESSNDIIKVLTDENIWAGLIHDVKGYQLEWRDGSPSLWLSGYPKWTLKFWHNNREDILDEFINCPNIHFENPDGERFLCINDINYYYTRPYFFSYEYRGNNFRFAWQNWGYVDMYDGNVKLYDKYYSQYGREFNIAIDKTQENGLFCKGVDEFIKDIEKCIDSYERFIKENHINQ